MEIIVKTNVHYRKTRNQANPAADLMKLMGRPDADGADLMEQMQESRDRRAGEGAGVDPATMEEEKR